MIRIMLVDDHALVRDAVRSVLEQDGGMQVVAEVGDGETALWVGAELAPDLVLMDVALPGISGIETTRQLLAGHPDIKVLALSTYPDPGIVRQMLEAGASGYITKSAAGVELMPGIRSVLAGQSYFCAEIAARMAADGPPDGNCQRESPAAAAQPFARK